MYSDPKPQKVEIDKHDEELNSNYNENPLFPNVSFLVPRTIPARNHTLQLSRL